MKKLFIRGMFLLLLMPIVLLAITLFIFYNKDGIGTWGINKTVGWAWDITNFTFFQYLLYPVYLIGYGVLSLLKIKTNYKLSVTHFGLIILPVFLSSNPNLSLITICLTFLSLLIFIINVAYSISLKVKNQQT